MEQEEKYLGGFYSALQLALGRWQVGLGIYFTDRRVFLVQRDRFELDKKSLLTSQYHLNVWKEVGNQNRERS